MSWFKNVFSGKKGEENKAAHNPDHSPTTDKSAEEAISEKDADEVLEEDNRSLISQLIAQHGLTTNMELSKVTLPTFILEPRSLLEKLGDTVIHPEVFAEIPNGTSPEERMKNVVKWYMSAYHKRPRGVKKPFNPVLGEVFEADFIPDESTGTTGSNAHVKWISEQVSHHPPISAFYSQTHSGSVVMQGHFAPKSRFLGNSAASIGEGGFQVYLKEHDEVYYFTWPTVYVRGVIFGRLLMELGGPVLIRCPNTNVHADLEFVVKGYFTGTHNAVTGTIYAGNPEKKKERMNLLTIEGSWVEKIFTKDAKKGKEAEPELLFDYSKATGSKMGACVVDESSPLASDEYNSRVQWKEALEAVRVNDQKVATDAKTAVEDAQRAIRKEREAKGETFKPRFFKVVKELEEYQYIGEGAIPIPPPPGASPQ